MVRLICTRRGAELPEALPQLPFMEEAYRTTEQQLRQRLQK
jgi:hypothetical protein